MRCPTATSSQATRPFTATSMPPCCSSGTRPLALILFAIAVEFFLLRLWLRVGPKIFAEDQLRVASMLYLSSALSLQFVAVDGQDNVLVVRCCVLLSLSLAMQSREMNSRVVCDPESPLRSLS